MTDPVKSRSVGQTHRWETDEHEAAMALDWAAFLHQYPQRSFYAWYGHRRSAGHPHPWGQGPGPTLITTTIDPVPVPPFDAAVVLKALDALQRALGQQRQQQQEAHIVIDTDRPIGIAFLSDFHIGNIQTRHDLLERDIARIAAHPALFAIVGGDAVDNFAASTHANAIHEDLLSPEHQWQLFRHFLLTLEGSLLAVGEGNHDAWTRKAVGIDPMLHFLRDIVTVNTQEGGLLTIQVGQVSYRIARKHTPRNNNHANPTHAVKVWYDRCPWPFDVGVLEHHHTPTIEPFLRHGLERIAIRTGTYKPQDRYGLELGYYDAELAVPVVIFDPRERKMVPFKHLDDALLHLDAITRARAGEDSHGCS